ncbi:MAG: oligosaccharide flippase family protein, partial [Bacteroidales bacterium]
VGAEDYGLYFAIFNFALIFSFILDPGIHNHNSRYLAQNPSDIQEYISNILSLKLLLGGLFILVVLGVGFLIGYDTVHFKLLIPIVFLHFFISLTTYLRTHISALLHFSTDSFLSIMDRVFSIILCAIVLWSGFFGKFDILWFVYIQIFAYMLSAFMAYVLVRKYAGKIKLKWSRSFIQQRLKEYAPYGLFICLMLLYTRLDSVLLERLLPADRGALAAGIYASAYRLIDAVNMVPAMFVVLLLPLFANLLKRNEKVNEILQLSVSILWILMIVFAINCCFAAFPIMNLLYTSYVSVSAKVFQILVLGSVATAIALLFIALLTAGGYIKRLNYIASIAIIINVIFNFILIPKYQSLGAAIANFATQFSFLLMSAYLILKEFKLSISFSYMGRLLGFLVGMVLINGVCSHFMDDVWLVFLLASAFSVVLFFSLGLISYKKILVFIKTDLRKN